LVAQCVVLGRDHDSRCHPGEVLGVGSPRRRDQRVLARGRVRGVAETEHPAHPGRRHLAVLPTRLPVRRRDHVENRVMQYLQCQSGAACVPDHAGDCGAQPTAGALSSDAQTGTVPLPGRVGRPHHDIVDLLDRDGERVLWGSVVVDVEDDHVGVCHQISAPCVVLFGQTDHEPASVHIDVHGGGCARPGGTVDGTTHLTVTGGHGDVAGVGGQVRESASWGRGTAAERAHRTPCGPSGEFVQVGHDSHYEMPPELEIQLFFSPRRPARCLFYSFCPNWVARSRAVLATTRTTRTMPATFCYTRWCYNWLLWLTLSPADPVRARPPPRPGTLLPGPAQIRAHPMSQPQLGVGRRR